MKNEKISLTDLFCWHLNRIVLYNIWHLIIEGTVVGTVLVHHIQSITNKKHTTQTRTKSLKVPEEKSRKNPFFHQKSQKKNLHSRRQHPTSPLQQNPPHRTIIFKYPKDMQITTNKRKHKHTRSRNGKSLFRCICNPLPTVYRALASQLSLRDYWSEWIPNPGRER